MKTQNKLIMISCAGMLLCTTLLFYVLQTTTTYYYTIDEVMAGGIKRQQEMRVKGHLDPTSIAFDPMGPTLTFTLTDGANQLTAIYDRPAPEHFMHADEVIIEGILLPAGYFEVRKLMLQCASRYESQEGGT